MTDEIDVVLSAERSSAIRPTPRQKEWLQKGREFQEELAGKREFEGYILTKESEYNLWTISTQDGSKLPQCLEGLWTTATDCMQAIRNSKK